MRLQAVLTPPESKKLLAKAVLKRDDVRRALSKDWVVLHPSSSTVFILDELGIRRPTSLWACGLVHSRGLCGSGNLLDELGHGGKLDASHSTHAWILDKGNVAPKLPLSEILERMGPYSVYVKGVNAIDPWGHVGVLFSGKGGGTIGVVIRSQRRKGFQILVPVGLEKLVPTKISDCAKAANKLDITHAHGTPCGILPLKATVMTEREAFRLLCGVEAVPVAAGGLAGAEGCVVFMLMGTSKALSKAEDLLSQIKGACLPRLYLLDCEVCPRNFCHNSPLFEKI